MMPPALIAEASRRFVREGEVRATKERILASIRGECFDKQQAFIADPSRFKAARCTRRAGKSELIARYAASVAYETGGIVRIWAITRLRVKELHWRLLKDVLTRAGIEFTPNESELKVFLATGGEIRLVGADKEKETEKKRGDKTVLEIVDEAQMFGAFLQTLCDDVIGPSLMDMRGTLCLMGTPGIVCSGYWYEATRNEAEARQHGFSFHFWSVLDNPHMPHAAVEIAEMKKRRGWGDDHPTYLREYRGQWVNDSGALVYRYDEARNGFKGAPPVALEHFVVGLDLGSGGSNDPMALHVWGWSEADGRLWQRFSKKYTEATTTSAAMGDFFRLREECGGFLAQVIDTGGGGKLTANDILERWGVRFEPAQKTEKHSFQRLMNDDFTAGLVMVDAAGPYAQELATLPKDPDDELKEDPRFDNHCSDAALYAWRKARHYWHQPQTEKPKPGTVAAYEAEAQQMEAAAEAEAQSRLGAEWWEQ